MTGVALGVQRQSQRLAREGNGQVVGSSLLGQAFKDPVLPPAPSAAGDGSDAMTSRLEPRPDEPDAIADVRKRVLACNAQNRRTGSVPVDAVTSSGSGLDP